MTTVYFVRHAQSDAQIHDPMTRPLSAKGMADRALVTAFLADKGVDRVLSSPYRRAVDTVGDFAQRQGLTIEIVEDFRERKTSTNWMTDGDFFAVIEQQWRDFHWKKPEHESLLEVQTRNIAALGGVLRRYGGQTLVVGTHGIALSTIINHYDPTYGYESFLAMVHLMPWVVKMRFDGERFVSIESFDLLAAQG